MTTHDSLEQAVVNGIAASLDVAPITDHIGTSLYEGEVRVHRSGSVMMLEVLPAGYTVPRKFVVSVIEMHE